VLEGAEVTTYYVTLELAASAADPDDPVTADDVAGEVRHAVAALRDLDRVDGVYDVDCILAAASGEVTFTGFVDTDDGFDRAAQLFVTRVRAAIHAAEGNTAGWGPTFARGELTVGAPEPTPA
jgi:hypothetical protein